VPEMRKMGVCDVSEDLHFYTPDFKYDNLAPRDNERNVREWVLSKDRSFAGKRKCFLDVGANSGAWTLRVAELYRQVIAVEPCRENLIVLSMNLSLNGFYNTTILPIAAWDTPKMLWLNTMYEGNYNSEIHVAETEGDVTEYLRRNPGYDRPFMSTKAVKSYAVQAEALDLLNLSPSAIKIDVEGGEVHVVKGLLDTIERCHPTIMCEMHATEYEEEIRAILEPIGYRMERLGQMQRGFSLE
jgi:FkbM family methyltransferase